MSDKAKNRLIIFLILIIAVLTWMLFVADRGRYCKPILRSPHFGVADTLGGPSGESEKEH